MANETPADKLKQATERAAAVNQASADTAAKLKQQQAEEESRQPQVSPSGEAA